MDTYNIHFVRREHYTYRVRAFRGRSYSEYLLLDIGQFHCTWYPLRSVVAAGSDEAALFRYLNFSKSYGHVQAMDERVISFSQNDILFDVCHDVYRVDHQFRACAIYSSQ